MGEVYRATDAKLGRDVALKVLPAEMAASPERVERFRREAKALAALDHPGIVTVTEDPEWFEWSAGALERCADESPLVINPIVYAEISVGFERVEDLEALLPQDAFIRSPLPWDAAFLAGKCFRAYRRRGDERRSPLPDFYIGAHAAVAGLSLLTRDPGRYRTYFPKLRLVAPAAAQPRGERR